MKNLILPWMSQFKSDHWATEHWFSELADGINGRAGESNALCAVKIQLFRHLMHKHTVASDRAAVLEICSNTDR